MSNHALAVFRIRVSLRRLAVTLITSLLVVACTPMQRDHSPNWSERMRYHPAAPSSDNTQAIDTMTTPTGDATPKAAADHAFVQPGNDQMIRMRDQAVADARVQADGDIKLNFQNANLLEVIKIVLGDMLGLNYVIDPRVQGSVSMQSSRPLRREDLLPTLEMLLRMNDTALVESGDGYQVLPLANALTGVRAPQLGDTNLPLPPGYSVRVMPLKYVAAEEMVQILEPFVAGGKQLLRVDTRRNLLILAGSADEMERLLETVYVFDVDRMRGMSVAMFTPDFVDAKTLGSELEALLADPEQGPMSGLVRFIVIERLNGLMVVTPRAEFLARIQEWVERLDKDGGSDAGRRLFIYRVQNGKATDLADMLSQLFAGDNAGGNTPAAEVAPGLTPITIGADGTEGGAGTIVPAANARTLAIGGEDPGKPPGEVRVIADEPNNALLILASSGEYRQILNALKQLDISPMQVLVEVTIAEVSLTDNLQYGVEWFFQNASGRGLSGIATLDLGVNGVAAVQPGFSYAVAGAGNVVRGVLNMLATESNLSVISSPTLLVLNNQEASIQVGDEVPVSTQQQQSTQANANIINSIEYRETGILLKVKPRINAGGLVIMDVVQEASLVPSTSNTDTLTPRIQQRKLKSTVAVNSGDTIILGGLIQDNGNRSESGVPVLHTLPLFGALFGNKADNQARTELLVLITPRAVSSRATALQVTEAFRRKLHTLIPLQETPERGPGSTNSIPMPQPTVPPQQADGPAQTDTPTQANAPVRSVASAPAATPPPESEASAALVCERLGPFPTSAQAQALATRLPAVGQRIEEESFTQTLGHKVLIPAQADAADAQQMLAQVKAAGFQEALLYQAGPLKNTISLGVYARAANADAIEQRARAAGLPVERIASTQNATRYWLDLQYPVASNSAIADTLTAASTSGIGRQIEDCASVAIR